MDLLPPGRFVGGTEFVWFAGGKRVAFQVLDRCPVGQSAAIHHAGAAARAGRQAARLPTSD